MKSTMFAFIIFLSATPALAEDILPFRFEYKVGEVQSLAADSLTYIDNSAVFLNPDQEGKHESQFLYKAKQLNDIPYLEVRSKGFGGEFEVSIFQDGDWQPVGTITSKKKWLRQKFDLQDTIKSFADKSGTIKVRVVAKSKTTKSLEIDYIGITTDKPVERPTETAGT